MLQTELVFPLKHAPPATFHLSWWKFLSSKRSKALLRVVLSSSLSLISQSNLWANPVGSTFKSTQNLSPHCLISHRCLSSSHLIRAPSSFSQLILTGGLPASLLLPPVSSDKKVVWKASQVSHAILLKPLPGFFHLLELKPKFFFFFLIFNLLFICIQ